MKLVKVDIRPTGRNGAFGADRSVRQFTDKQGYTWTYIEEARWGGSIFLLFVEPLPHGSVAVPSEIDGRPVTRIGGNLFKGALWMEEVSLPHTLQSIASGAFRDCRNLRLLDVPGGVTDYDEIGLAANGVRVCLPPERSVPWNYREVDGCAVLTGYVGDSMLVRVPETVDGLPVAGIRGSLAFEGEQRCVMVPECVRFIGESTLREVFTERNVVFDFGRSRKPWFVEEGNIIYSSDGSEIITALPVLLRGSCSVKYGVKRIREEAFAGCRLLSELILPGTVNAIGSHAFRACTGLKTVALAYGDTGIFDRTLFSSYSQPDVCRAEF